MAGETRFVLDTNVVSEFMRPPDGRFGESGWTLLSTQTPLITAITQMEVLTGIYTLPNGRRRDSLIRDVRRVLAGITVLSFDAVAAETSAALIAARRRQGRPLPVHDGMIAAICLSRGLPVVTRNVSDFSGIGLEIINPWEG